MTRSILATATLAALVALAGCSSNDDDMPADTSTDPTGETSELAPDRELSSEPGGDTRAIAGYWNASLPQLESDSRFVLITENGLQTSYELQQNDIDGSNCYSEAGPQTLTPGADDGYALDDGTTYTAVRGDDDATLTVTREPDLVQEWTLVENMMPGDLPLCSGEEEVDPAGSEVTLPVEGGPEDPDSTSMLNEDAPVEPPSPDPSGNDTSAIAGLWNATDEDAPEGRVDERYVLISDDGLWTDYDYRQDALGDEGNCYFITPLRLDLETGDAASGRYSIADGRGFDVTPTDGDDTLALAFDGNGSGDVADPTALTWPRVENESAADLEACESE